MTEILIKCTYCKPIKRLSDVGKSPKMSLMREADGGGGKSSFACAEIFLVLYLRYVTSWRGQRESIVKIQREFSSSAVAKTRMRKLHIPHRS